MQISWQAVALVALLVAGAVVAGLWGPLELATALAGLAAGLVPRFGMLGRGE
jgi:hypothetical protein